MARNGGVADISVNRRSIPVSTGGVDTSPKIEETRTIMEEEVREPKRSPKALIIVLVVAVVLSGGAAAYFYNQAQELRANPQAAATQEEINSLVARVGALIVLPEGETPTVATVTDPEALRDQPFFANAKAGYRVLIFTNARKAILYDPENNKIVEVAPVDIGAPTENEGASE